MKTYDIVLVNCLRYTQDADSHLIHTSEAGKITHVEFLVGEEVVFTINGEQFSRMNIKEKTNGSQSETTTKA